MDHSLSKQPLATAISFTNEMLDRPRYGGAHLLALLKDKMLKNQPITKENIVEAYIKTCSKDGSTIRIRYNLHHSKVTAIQADKSHPIVRQRALNWFKLNLGAAIIKGKLLVIPVIDIE